MIIIIPCKIPFVTMEVKKPTNEPIPALMACFKSVFVINNSPITAPINGPSKIPITGITKGPIISPIVLPHIPAFVPPNFFTPMRFEMESAANKSTTNKISITQKNHPSSEKEKKNP